MSLTPNAYPGLAEGPIDNKASSVVNAVFNPNSPFALPIGFPVKILLPPASQLLPVVDFIFNVSDALRFYGIPVAGDRGGIYPRAGSGFANPDDTFATPDNPIIASPGDGVRVCTQGRCVAQVGTIASEINVGDPLTVIIGQLALGVAISGDNVVARALQFVAQKAVPEEESYAVVDIQREGILP